MASALLALLVSIEVSGPELPADQRAALEAACSHATGGECQVGAAAAPDAVAIVALDAQRRHAIVEVGRRRGDAKSWLSRELAFAPEDAVLERFKAIGLTIATLAGDVQERETAENEAAAARTAEPPAAPKVNTPQRPPETPRAPDAADETPSPALQLAPSIAFGALVGTALDAGAARAGGFLRASLKIDDASLWPTLSVSYAQRTSDSQGLTLSWLTASAGVAAGVDLDALRLSGRLRLEAELERIGVQQTLPPTDSGSRWVPGLRLGAEAAWPADGSLAVFVSGEGRLQLSATRFTVAERTVARLPRTALTAAAGIELRF